MLSLRTLPHDRQLPWNGGPDWPSNLTTYHTSGILRGCLMMWHGILASGTTRGFPLEIRRIRFRPRPGPPRLSSPSLDAPPSPDLGSPLAYAAKWKTLTGCCSLMLCLPLVWWLQRDWGEVAIASLHVFLAYTAKLYAGRLVRASISWAMHILDNYHICAPLATTIMSAWSSRILAVIDVHSQRAFPELTRANKMNHTKSHHPSDWL